ncbi:Rhodanese-like protein [Aspergillus steynii IBT 23096]|uniref:Rhodanese-like protein n=1 Tax=Aspergillus steynii IBT 23096 TaxID=1392250 RepID=A0A2I2G6Z2_9EURO|nr:Rhodanese-like protein [Aspergillus steynii IBT 23096]PLB48640.1 Rhodanese-like protein [Aspergillus steynii IBT 23096]
MFSSKLITPQDFHEIHSQSHDDSQRIIPVAAGRTAHIPFFNASHIPGSIFFNMDIIRNPDTPYPLMVPTPATFSREMSKLGLRPSDVVVVYDAAEIGTYNAPRVAWMFRIFGHKHVHVLNNFRLYKELGLPVETGDVVGHTLPRESGEAETYPCAQIDQEKVISYSDLCDLLAQADQTYQILDTRTNALFTGEDGYSDPSIQRGHIPGSVNIPLSTVLNENGAIKTPSELRALFEQSGLSEKPVILSCNSGVTAATVEVALEESGYAMPKRLYDGSWMEWGKVSSPASIARGKE